MCNTFSLLIYVFVLHVVRNEFENNFEQANIIMSAFPDEMTESCTVYFTMLPPSIAGNHNFMWDRILLCFTKNPNMREHQ